MTARKPEWEQIVDKLRIQQQKEEARNSVEVATRSRVAGDLHRAMGAFMTECNGGMLPRQQDTVAWIGYFKNLSDTYFYWDYLFKADK